MDETPKVPAKSQDFAEVAKEVLDTAVVVTQKGTKVAVDIAPHVAKFGWTLGCGVVNVAWALLSGILPKKK